MPKPSATSRLSGAGPNAVSRMSAPASAAAVTPSPNSSRNAAKTDRAASGDGAAVRARTSSTGSPGRAQYSSPQSRTRWANRSCAASATWWPACCSRRPRPVKGATSPREPAVTIRIRIASLRWVGCASGSLRCSYIEPDRAVRRGRLPPRRAKSLSMLVDVRYATAMSEETLPGGNTDGAVRIGDVVHKRASPWTPTVHALLRHLEHVDVDGVPRALGFDDQG